MTTHHRDTHCSGSYTDGFIAHNFLGFIYHFHLLFRVPIIKKHINLWNDIEIDWILIRHFTFDSFSLIQQLIDGLYPRSCNTLISAHNNTLCFIAQVQWIKCNHHLNGRAIWIGNNFIFCSECIGIDFRYHKFLCWIHSPC